MLLADLGCDVIKLEATKGEPMRGVSRVFAGCQRGKRGIAVDLKHPAAREVLESLVHWADVVHHNLRAPAARKLGIDYDTLRPLNPRMIYCHTSSYGPVGPRADWPGFDQLFQAYSGWEVEGGGEGNPPMWHRMGMMDHQNALASLVATLLGLYQRERTGEGQLVTASILGASVLTASETMIFADGSIAPVAHLNHEQTGIAPGYRIYPVRDGWVAVAALRAGQLEALLKVAGADAASEVERCLAELETASLLAALEDAGVPAERVQMDQCDAFFERAANRESNLTVSYPHADWGRLDQIGAFWSFGDLAPRLDRAPPALGEHTRSVLRELGIASARIDELEALGAIR
jgi:crotonobetainyl-CoA:carnitine CoA-transferase CaiB-like acyl-CoA transferase